MNPFEMAKKILQQRGWCKGSRHERGTDKSCLLGAFEHNAGNSVYEHFDNDAPEGPILKAVVLERFPDRLGNDEFNCKDVGPEDDATTVICCFNNHPDTTLSDVNAVLDAAAKTYKTPTPEPATP